MSLGGITGAAGQIASAAMNAAAIKEATQMQIDAIERQKQFVYNNLDPSVVGGQATQADINRALNQRALQGMIDPNLLSSRYGAEAAIQSQLGELGKGNAAAVSGAAASEALAPTAGIDAAKQKLIEAANKELAAGATLPPDVQAELVKAGLEKSGMVTGAASGQGTGGQILRTILGSAGLQLQKQRQEQAAGMLTAAQNLTASRASILQGLFPSLSNQQLANLGGAQNVLTQANALTPNAGLSGTDVANIWLARVGATNQLTQQAAQIGAQGALGQAGAYGQMIGAGTNSLGQIANGWLNSSGGSGGVTQVNADLGSNPAGPFM